MVSKIVVIADATTESLELILETLKTIQGDQLYVQALFTSRLWGISLKNLGYNILTLLMQEEQEALQRARVYFTLNDIHYDIRMMPGSDGQALSKELEAQEYDILIIQGGFADIWRKDPSLSNRLEAITESADPVWVLKGPKKSSTAPIRPQYLV